MPFKMRGLLMSHFATVLCSSSSPTQTVKYLFFKDLEMKTFAGVIRHGGSRPMGYGGLGAGLVESLWICRRVASTTSLALTAIMQFFFCIIASLLALPLLASPFWFSPAEGKNGWHLCLQSRSSSSNWEASGHGKLFQHTLASFKF
jgi:hypothetical protein